MENNVAMLISHLEKCFEKAEKGESKLTDAVLDLNGFSGLKTRHFYNNLLDFDDCRYLEIGAWTGSTVSAAMYKNTSTVVCIDNWSEYEGEKAKKIFFENFEKFKGANLATFIEGDCFNIHIDTLNKFNFYLYDGRHNYEDHFNAVSYYIDALDDLFVLVVDDWNWERVRTGTIDAIKDLNLSILWNREIRLTQNDEHTPRDIASATWWNGISVFLLQKNNLG